MSAIVYSPVKLVPGSKSQRHITPSSEKFLVKDTIIISPKKRAASSTMVTETGSPQKKKMILPLNTDIEVKSISDFSSAQPINMMSRRIVFDDFTLVKPNGWPRTPNEQERKIIMSIFPGTYGYAIEPPYLIIRVHQLPPKPWPLSVGGLPLYLTSDREDLGFEHGVQGRGGKALDDLDARPNITNGMLKAIITHFKKLQVPITSIMYFKTFWIIVVKDGTELSSLPGMLAKVLCQYKLDSQQVEPLEAALRLKEPTSLIRDDSDYSKDLRPGVMLGSSGHKATIIEFFGKKEMPAGVEMLTTSGVLVRNIKNHAEKYVTVANHGFPIGQENVFHPTVRGKRLGAIQKRLESTDIAMLKLESGLTYSNQTFGTSDIPPADIKRICGEDELSVGDSLHMNSPFTGFYDMMTVAVGVNLMKISEEERRLWTHTDEPDQPGFQWIKAAWNYVGNSNVAPTEGCCGTPILNENNDLVAFFRFLVGYNAVTIAAHVMKHYGFELDPDA